LRASRLRRLDRSIKLGLGALTAFSIAYLIEFLLKLCVAALSKYVILSCQNMEHWLVPSMYAHFVATGFRDLVLLSKSGLEALAASSMCALSRDPARGIRYRPLINSPLRLTNYLQAHRDLVMIMNLEGGDAMPWPHRTSHYS